MTDSNSYQRRISTRLMLPDDYGVTSRHVAAIDGLNDAIFGVFGRSVSMQVHNFASSALRAMPPQPTETAIYHATRSAAAADLRGDR